MDIKEVRASSERNKITKVMTLGAMEEDRCFKVFSVLKTINCLLDGLDFGVQHFRKSIRDRTGIIGQHIPARPPASKYTKPRPN